MKKNCHYLYEYPKKMTNLLSQFEKTIQHYRPVIDGLSYEPHVRELAIQILLVSRATEIGIRRIHDHVLRDLAVTSDSSEPPQTSKMLLTVLDTLAAMDLYRDLLTRLFDEYLTMFDLTLDYEGLLTTPSECMIHAQNIEADVEGWKETESLFRRDLINKMCSREPGENYRDIRSLWDKHLIVWRYLIQSRQEAIRMMRNRLVYILRV